MFTLSSPHLLRTPTPRVSFRRQKVRHPTPVTPRAVLKNGGFKNGDVSRGEDTRGVSDATKPTGTHDRPAAARSPSVATDGRAPTRHDLTGSEVPNGATRKNVSNDETSSFFFDDHDHDDAENVPLFTKVNNLRAPLSRPKQPPSTKIPISRWPAFNETAVEFDEEFALRRGAVAPLVTPPWRVMLLSDGSVTRHLQLLTDSTVQVDVLRQELVLPSSVAGDASVPVDVLDILTRDMTTLVGGDTTPTTNTTNHLSSKVARVVHREVDLCDGRDGTPLVYASSWWTEEAATAYGILTPSGGATTAPVWNHLRAGKTELYRDVKRVYLGSSAVLEQAWGTAGPFWARHYIFWAGNAPLCVIYEVFSPSLERFLGPGKFDIGE